ncbi:MAG: TIGR01440 family protein [Oscillospiraceae bacterium]|nr:TIGR01440 family protein [Oscillospiraceae bacterium]
MIAHIQTQAKQAIDELLATANLTEGDLFVVGCSTSEVAGQMIGKAGSYEIAQSIFEGLYPTLYSAGIQLAAQCCEHLNRALVVERAFALAKGLTIVSAVPQLGAGGAFAAYTWDHLIEPVLVESVRAQAGLDIGLTMIGMHLQAVAVPVRLQIHAIGQAPIIAARTRPKLIGGARAAYAD